MAFPVLISTGEIGKYRIHLHNAELVLCDGASVGVLIHNMACGWDPLLL